MESPDLWIKTLHILAVISWMPGMLYLPRLFVCHAGAQPKSETSELFKVMERRLFKGVVNPAMVVTVATGLWLACREEYFLSPWMRPKLALAAGLLGLRVFFGLQVLRSAGARLRRGSQGVPGLLLSIDQGSADRADDPHRLPGGDEAVLTGRHGAEKTRRKMELPCVRACCV
jgi:uncharacterized integral membrane protein (TIGR00701 family)